MSTYIYLLYREEKRENKTYYHFFNSTFVEHKIFLSQLFKEYRWIESTMIRKPYIVKTENLEWTDIIYFNRLTIHFARLLGLFIHKKWYKIQKVKIVD
jgi:hypothetical protein